MSSPPRFAWLRVVGRVLGAVVFAYAAAAALVALGAVVLPRATSMAASEAVVLSSILGFPLFVAALVWAFRQRDLGFRRSMSWLHTWSGVVLGGVLFAVFWMGTLSVFDRELDRWMMPATRLSAPSSAQLSLDALARPVAERLAPKGAQWQISPPTERVPTLQLRWKAASGENVVRHVDPATGRVLETAGTLGGTGFIFPFHYRLHLSFMDLGQWLVGLAAMCMLIAIVSGVVIHRKLIVDFFSFRPARQTERMTLDLHTLTGVVALPFHLLIALSGLVIMFELYLPSGWKAAYPDRAAFAAESADTFRRDKAKRPGALASLDAMTAEARRLWGQGEPAQLRVWHPGDANAYVEVRRAVDDRVTMDREIIYFDGTTGAVLKRAELRPVMRGERFLEGLHMVQYRHWTLRGLYFVGGLAGCVLIATGFLYWLTTRRKQHARAGGRVVETLAVGVVAGIVVATMAFLVANRLLPSGAQLGETGRAELEMWVFYLMWLASFGHAAWRGRAAWVEQSYAVAVLAIAAVLLNWITTGDHLLASLRNGSLAVAGVDLLLLAAGATAWRVARWLVRCHARPASASVEDAHA